MKPNELKKTFVEGSKRRLKLLKSDLLRVYSRNDNHVNQLILEKYLEVINEKVVLFEKVKTSTETKKYDISEIESDVSLLLDDIVLNCKDKDNLYSGLKEIFYEYGIFLVFYPTILLESPDFRVFSDVFFIGVPIGILNERTYFPLVLHEIGHNILSKTDFNKFNEAITLEVGRITENALRPSNLDRVNVRLLNRARFYERVSESWLSELTSDIFGVYMAGCHYIEAFVLYQLNKRYFADVDDHPTNKLRYLYLTNYLATTESCICDETKGGIEDLVNTDTKQDNKFRLLQEEQYQEFVFEGFQEEIKNNPQLPLLKDRVKKLLDSHKGHNFE